MDGGGEGAYNPGPALRLAPERAITTTTSLPETAHIHYLLLSHQEVDSGTGVAAAVTVVSAGLKTTFFRIRCRATNCHSWQRLSQMS